MFGYFPWEITVFPTKSTSTFPVYVDLISQRRGGGEGSVIFGEGFAARYTERAMRKKAGGQKVLWVLIRRTSGRVPWRGFICANEITVISSTPCLILRQPVCSPRWTPLAQPITRQRIFPRYACFLLRPCFLSIFSLSTGENDTKFS